MTSQILLPEGWRAASEPALARTGDVLSGTFREIPSDALAVTVQAPPPASGGFSAVLPWLVGVTGLLAGGWISAWAGRQLGRRRRTSAWALPLTFVLAFLWCISLFAAVSARLDAGREALGQQASWTYGYGDHMLMALGFPLFLLLVLIVFQSAAFLARRRAARTQE